MPIERSASGSESWITSPEYIDYAARSFVAWWGNPVTGRFADIGCSRGEITEAIAGLLPSAVAVEGIDPSPVVPRAPWNGRVRFFQKDGIEYLTGQPDQSFDGILLKQVLHCLSADRQSQLFREMHRTLTANGKVLVLGMPDPRRVQVPLFKAALERYETEYQSADSILLLAKEFGFRAMASEFCYSVRLQREDYFAMLRGRCLSILDALTDAEIERGVAELAEKFPGAEISFDDKLYAFHLTKTARA